MRFLSNMTCKITKHFKSKQSSGKGFYWMLSNYWHKENDDTKVMQFFPFNLTDYKNEEEKLIKSAYRVSTVVSVKRTNAAWLGKNS